MIQISHTANIIYPSLTRQIFNKSKALSDVIDLSLGDPDIQTQVGIKNAAIEAIKQGRTRYSQNAGLLELRETVCEYYKRAEGFSYDPLTETIITVGAMEGLYLAFLSILNPDDEVIILAPYYVNYVQMVEMCNAKPVIIQNKDDLSINIERVKESINSHTKAIVINTPANPSGQIIPWTQIEELAKIAKENDLAVISDEVYKCLIYDGASFRSIVSIDGMRERTILVNSLSKQFCMTGYRVGYVLAPEEVVSAMTKLQENVAACAPLPSQYAAIEALSGRADYSKNMVDTFSERRNVLYEGLCKIPLIKPILPEATFYMMVNISETGMKSLDFSLKLLEHSHVAVVPGVAYGEYCDEYIRIAFTQDVNVIKEGISRINSFIKYLMGNEEVRNYGN